MNEIDKIANELFRQIDAQCDLTVGQCTPISEAIEDALWRAYRHAIQEASIEIAKSLHKLNAKTKETV